MERWEMGRLVPLVLFLTSLSVRASAQLHTEGTTFRDARGGMVVLRGLNVAGDSKVPPFRPVDDVRMFDAFADYGVNVVRLLFTWEAFEATRGSHDESYFDYYRGLIDALHARGIGVIVDFHQDAFSRFATDGCGEGMPAWAISPAVMPDVPDNGPDCAGWGLKFILDGDTHRNWDDFYADTNGVRTSYLNLLDLVSSRLSSHPGVIGYDIINEPWGDEVQQIGPLYADAARIIRAHHEDAILFVSPQALTSAGQDTKLEKPAFANFAYAPHYYDGVVIQLHRWLGGSLAEPVNRMVSQAQRWNVPLFLGEFGGPGEGVNVGPYMDEFYAQLDVQFVSSAQWSWVAHWDAVKKDGWNVEDFAVFDLAGAPRVTYKVRPYPARIAGKPVAFQVGSTPRATVTLAWTHEPAQGETRIFAPYLPVFGAQPLVETDDDVTCEYTFDRRQLVCTSSTPGDKRLRVRACEAGETCTPTALAPTPDAGLPEPEPDPERDAGVMQPADPPQRDDAGVVSPRVDPADGCSAGSRATSLPALLILLALGALGRRRRS